MRESGAGLVFFASIEQMSFRELRVQRRTPLEVEVGFETDSTFYTGWSGNISEEGLFLRTGWVSAWKSGRAASSRASKGSWRGGRRSSSMTSFLRVEAAQDHCPDCGGAAARAAHTRAVSVRSEEVYYLAYLWRCSVCGHEWEDQGLRHLNAAAARQAR